MTGWSKQVVIETAGKAVIAGAVAGLAVLAGSSGDYSASTWAAVAVAFGRAAFNWLAEFAGVEVSVQGTAGHERVKPWARFIKKYL